MNGYNVTIFAYGQTSSGKTFTMSGSEQEKGLIQLSANDIFRKVRELEDEVNLIPSPAELKSNDERKFGSLVPPEVIKKSIVISIQFLEIYNESVNDLLDPTKKNLEVREDKKQIVIEGLTKIVVKSPEEIEERLQAGILNRKISQTKANAQSSRSHTVFRIELQATEKNI